MMRTRLSMLKALGALVVAIAMTIFALIWLLNVVGLWTLLAAPPFAWVIARATFYRAPNEPF